MSTVITAGVADQELTVTADGYVQVIPSAFTGTTSPQLVLGYDTARAGRNIVHDLIGGGIAVALIKPRLRSGRLELLYPVEADAWACLALHGLETTFQLTDTDVPAIGMRYVLDGEIELRLDEQTQAVWIVTVPYQEVEA